MIREGTRLTRREWLASSLALAGIPRAAWAASAGEERIPFLDEVNFVADESAAAPQARHFDLRQLSDPLTPVEQFFVFHQTSIPRIDVTQWRLQVRGLFERPQAFSWAELTDGRFERAERETTIECAGNNPRGASLNGQVGNARWAGIPLAAVLRHCGLKPDTREVVFFGADHVLDAAGAGRGPHARSVFVQDVQNGEALLALSMNGEPLRPAHGAPLRLILPGWYGMAQIKWLTRIEALDRRYEGFHMSRNYHTLHRTEDVGGEAFYLPTSITRMRLKSVVAKITRPAGAARGRYRVAGAAWGGSHAIERVEVRIDGEGWRAARIDERRGAHAWLLWSYDWADARPGRHVVASRAIDSAGYIQPTREEWSQRVRTTREDNAQWQRAIDLPA